VLGAALLITLIRMAVGWPTLRQTAAILDARAQTRDRFQTALDFSALAERSPLQELALAECLRFARGFAVRPWTPLRLPPSVRWVIAPLLALALLVWYDGAFAHRKPPRTALDEAVDQRAAALEKIAAKLRENPAASKSPELDKIAEEMKKGAERLKAAAASDDEKRKAALRELSSLEAMLNALKAAQNQMASPAELAALAAALESNEQSRQAAEALKAGQLAQAASELEKLLEQLKKQGDPKETLQQLARSMQEQAAKLTEKEKSEIARQMQEAAQGAQSGQPQLSQQALQRLAELLRKAGRQGGSRPQGGGSQAGAGKPLTERQLQDLITALENMKEGMRAGDGSGGKPGEAPGQGMSLAIIESFSKKSGDPSAGQLPSGQPGSERDEGHNDKIYADKAPDPAKVQGPARRLEGLLGQGESLQQFLGAAGDASKSSQSYRELYEAMAPAAQDAVEQEEIPLGSRPFIRRYFENIRPRE
jgi:chemotaxis protein histidine kinase CheA